MIYCDGFTTDLCSYNVCHCCLAFFIGIAIVIFDFGIVVVVKTIVWMVMDHSAHDSNLANGIWPEYILDPLHKTHCKYWQYKIWWLPLKCSCLYIRRMLQECINLKKYIFFYFSLMLADFVSSVSYFSQHSVFHTPSQQYHKSPSWYRKQQNIKACDFWRILVQPFLLMLYCVVLCKFVASGTVGEDAASQVVILSRAAVLLLCSYSGSRGEAAVEVLLL